MKKIAQFIKNHGYVCFMAPDRIHFWLDCYDRRLDTITHIHFEVRTMREARDMLGY